MRVGASFFASWVRSWRFFVSLPGMIGALSTWELLLVISIWIPLMVVEAAALRYLARIGPIRQPSR
jgi:hypothetical protein